MKVRKLLAIALGKLILKMTQTLGYGGGSAAPGYYALKIYPQLVSDLASKLPKTVIITGTNGKTTTARMLAYFAENQGLKVLRNATGSNLERGVASTLIGSINVLDLLLGRKLQNYDLAIWELDEAAFNQVGPYLDPKIIVFLNVFRDQLDRYGEVDTVVKKWCQILPKFNKNTQILINGDDHNLLQLKKNFSGQIATFGVKDYKIEGEKVIRQAEQEALTFEAKEVKAEGLDKTSFKLIHNHKQTEVDLPLPGVYHIYNFLAAFGCVQNLGLPTETVFNNLDKFSPAFGRVEKIEFKSGGQDHQGYIFLIKNPAGATQVFQTIKNEIKDNDHLLFALNDNFADGKDVSWIWDANFELIQNLSRTKLKDFKIYISGTRAEDLAVRLKYAGFSQKSIKVEESLFKALEEAKKDLKNQGRLFILPTYTALLELQKILAKTKIKKHYWEGV
jgi:UDP-N-acetylmuramyl tripeptide synthase